MLVCTLVLDLSILREVNLLRSEPHARWRLLAHAAHNGPPTCHYCASLEWRASRAWGCLSAPAAQSRSAETRQEEQCDLSAQGRG